MMFKHHFIPYLIGACKQQQHLISLISLLILIVGSQTVSAQQPTARDAYAIFEQKCLICHGPDGAYRETLLIEHTPLIENGTVMPGNPEASELYKRLLITDTAKRMPLGSPPLSAPAIDTIRRWILAGAPDWAAIPPPDSRFHSHPVKYLIPLRLTLCHSQYLTAPSHAISHSHISIMRAETAEILQEYRIRALQTGQQPLMGARSHQPTVH